MTQSNQQLAKRPAPPKTLKDFLDQPSTRAKLAEVATSAMRPDDLTRLALMAASRQPEIAKCAPHTVLRALMDAAALGIKPGGLMGRGYLVPRKRNWKDASGKWQSELECHFDPGWRGLIDIARRSGKIKRIEAHPVYEGDRFLVTFGNHPTLVHEPDLDSEDRGEVRAAYAIAEFHDGSTQTEVLTKSDIIKIRNSSAAKGGPWNDWFDEMARKSAVRRLCKYLPFDPLLERALEAATDTEAEKPMLRDGAELIPLEAAKPRAKSLAEKISRNTTSPDGEGDLVPTEEEPSRPRGVETEPAPDEDDDGGSDDPDKGP